MPLDTALLKPAQIGTSEIATKNDITTSLGAYNPATVINTNTTTIDGGKITTGTITANQIAAGAVTTNELAVGAGIVNGYIQSSNFTTIDGAGFRLKSNAAGTSADPTIYGAYIKGGVLDGATITGQLLDISSMKVANGGTTTGAFSIVKYGNTSPTTVLRVYGKNYGTGYMYDRCLLSEQKIFISANIGYFGYPSGGASVQIKKSINGGAYTVLTSANANFTAATGALPISYLDIVNASSFSYIDYAIYGSCIDSDNIDTLQFVIGSLHTTNI